jgi:hypothetical protein
MDAGATPTTVTVKLQVSVPQSFEARHVTVVTPNGKALPEGGVQFTNEPLGVAAAE